MAGVGGMVSSGGSAGPQTAERPWEEGTPQIAVWVRWASGLGWGHPHGRAMWAELRNPRQEQALLLQLAGQGISTAVRV